MLRRKGLTSAQLAYAWDNVDCDDETKEKLFGKPGRGGYEFLGQNANGNFIPHTNNLHCVSYETDDYEFFPCVMHGDDLVRASTSTWFVKVKRSGSKDFPMPGQELFLRVPKHQVPRDVVVTFVNAPEGHISSMFVVFDRELPVTHILSKGELDEVIATETAKVNGSFKDDSLY